MEGLDAFKGGNIRTVALKLRDIFRLSGGNGNGRSANTSQRETQREASPAKDLPVVVNEPLDFELKNLDAEHPYLRERGFTEETVKTFKLGSCNRGLFKGRIVIPIHESVGRPLFLAVSIDREWAHYITRYHQPASEFQE